MNGELYPGEFEAMEHNGRMDALEQEPCEDWHDVPSDEMTLGQARQAVKDLRKKLAEYLWQTPCEDAISRRAVEKITWEEPSYSDALNVLTEVRDKVRALPSVNPQPKTGYISIDDVMSVFDDYMLGEVDEDGTDTFLKMLKDRAESEG